MEMEGQNQGCGEATLLPWEVGEGPHQLRNSAALEPLQGA